MFVALVPGTCALLRAWPHPNAPLKSLSKQLHQFPLILLFIFVIYIVTQIYNDNITIISFFLSVCRCSPCPSSGCGWVAALICAGGSDCIRRFRRRSEAPGTSRGGRRWLLEGFSPVPGCLLDGFSPVPCCPVTAQSLPAAAWPAAQRGAPKHRRRQRLGPSFGLASGRSGTLNTLETRFLLYQSRCFLFPHRPTFIFFFLPFFPLFFFL